MIGLKPINYSNNKPRSKERGNLFIEVIEIETVCKGYDSACKVKLTAHGIQPELYSAIISLIVSATSSALGLLK